MAETAAILGSIVVVGVAIRDLLSNRYRVPQLLKLLETRLATLRVEKQTLEAEIRRLGLTEDQGLKDLLGNALSNLEELKTRLEAKKPKGGGHTCGGCLPQLKWSLFPAELQEIVNSVTLIFDNVLESLKKQIEFKEVLQKRVLANLPSLQCHPDLRYIRLEKTFEKVMVALRNSNRSSLVLLHGGPGTGKSSLATDVAVQLQEDIVNRRALCDLQASNSSSVFDEVIFLECGPQMDPQVKQSELRERLGWSTSGDGVAHAQSDSSTITKTLSHLLKDRKLLVILDDVWKSGSKFLQLLIDMGGKNVKWFITSQLQGLCSDLNCKSIPISISMEEVALHNSRRILAVHIGLPETVISEVQDFMDPLIQKVNGNLLALTCIAPAIEPTRFNQKREWARLEKELSKLLDSMPESKFFQSKEYGRSYWEAVQVGFDFLSTRQQNLIILMYMCRGPSTREGIIEYLFEHTNDTYQTFSQARRELQRRGLIKVTNVNDSEEGEENTCSWSIHFLLKEFIKRKYFLSTDGSKLKTSEVLSDRSILFHNQMRCTQESDVLIAMVALYFQKEFAEELISKNSTQVDISQYTVQLVDSRDHVIEPVAQLLSRNEDTDWTSALRSATQRVFLEYSRRGVFDQDGTSTLLAATVSKRCMLTALSRYHQIEPHSFFGQVVVSSLVQLLETECICAVSGDPSGASSLGALSLLRRIAYQLGDQLQMDGCKIDDNDKLHLSKVVEQLRDDLAKSAPSSDIQVSSAEALASLVLRNDHISKKVVATSGLLEGLVTAIEDDGRKALQRASARAIARLARNSNYTRLKIVSCSGTLEALVAGVKKEEDETLQYYCVCALCNLAWNTNRIGLEIVNCNEALEALATGLNKEKSGRLGKSIAEWSVGTFGNLAQTSSEAKWKIVKLRGVLKHFVSAMARVNQDGAAQITGIMSNSAGALWRLAAGGDSIRGEMMDSCPGILRALTDTVTSLWNGGPKETENERGIIIRETMHALTLLDPGRAKEMHLDSAYVYWGRGNGMLTLGHYQEAVKGFDTCEALLQGSLCRNKDFYQFLSYRGCAKATASDFQGALADFNLLMEIKRIPFAFQERGVVKRMMGDLHGALADLDDGLCLEPNCFEMLKHRGFVKYLLHDKESAQIDAQQALQVRKEYGDCVDYNSNYVNTILGCSIVAYLDLQL